MGLVHKRRKNKLMELITLFIAAHIGGAAFMKMELIAP
jgi:hypothetical protein